MVGMLSAATPVHATGPPSRLPAQLHSERRNRVDRTLPAGPRKGCCGPFSRDPFLEPTRLGLRGLQAGKPAGIRASSFLFPRQGRLSRSRSGFSAMESVEELALGPCTASPYLRPFRLRYRQNDISKIWDFMRTHDSVSILIFNTSRQCFVVVKQFRPAVYMCELERQCPQDFVSDSQESWTPLPTRLPASAGVTYELCAGIVDKPGLSLEEIASEEVLEECGYEVPVASLKRVISYRTGVGLTGAKHTLFYAQVTDEMKTGAGGGRPKEGELIEVVEVPLQDAMSFAFDDTCPKTIGIAFSFMWFQSNVAPKLLEK